jgi:hypothetical protein
LRSEGGRVGVTAWEAVVLPLNYARKLRNFKYLISSPVQAPPFSLHNPALQDGGGSSLNTRKAAARATLRRNAPACLKSGELRTRSAYVRGEPRPVSGEPRHVLLRRAPFDQGIRARRGGGAELRQRSTMRAPGQIPVPPAPELRAARAGARCASSLGPSSSATTGMVIGFMPQRRFALAYRDEDRFQQWTASR